MTTELGSKLHHAFKNAALAEAAYDATEGEETEDTEQAQALAELSAVDAIEALAGGMRTVEHARKGRLAEILRLKIGLGELDRRTAWYENKLRELAAVTGKQRIHAGNFTVFVKAPTHKCIVAEGTDLPDALVTFTPEKTIEASCAPDKPAIKRWLKANPGKSLPGVTITDEPGKVVLS